METQKDKKTTSDHTILVAEDDAYLSRALVDKLDREGYTVLAAHNGQEAIDMLSNHQVNLVLLDIIMPMMDGFEVLEVAQQQGAKVIVLSNLGQESDMKRAKELGALDYFIKTDISLKDVVEKLEKYLNN